MKAFKLWMEQSSNGITVYNSMAEEDGGSDGYKRIARIIPSGKIQYYVPNGYIPDCDVKSIEEAAERQRQEFFSYWDSLNDIQKYEKLLALCEYNDFHEVVLDKAMALSEKVKRLEKRLERRNQI